jgi:hypothetical protein
LLPSSKFIYFLFYCLRANDKFLFLFFIIILLFFTKTFLLIAYHHHLRKTQRRQQKARDASPSPGKFFFFLPFGFTNTIKPLKCCTMLRS